MERIKDKVILITGAGRGSGRILAEVLARRGAIVAANDISPVNVDEVVSQIVARDGRARAYIDDVAKKVGAQNIINQVEEDFARIDVLINHAAVEPSTPLLEMDEWDWHRVLEVNLTGTFLMTQSAGRLMRAQGSGMIINLIPSPTHDGNVAYLASMNGLEGFTAQAARELRPYGIHVHSVQNNSREIVERVLALFDSSVEER